MPIFTLFVSNSAGQSEGFLLSTFYKLSSLFSPCSEKVPKRLFTIYGPNDKCSSLLPVCGYTVYKRHMGGHVDNLHGYTRVGDLCAIWVAAIHISCVRHEITKFSHKHV